jgi:putative ABC transport system permease protein
MSLWQTLRVALRALVRNRTRSFLTALGVMIGVGAVIAMVAIGEGAKSAVEKVFAGMGTNLLVVMSGSMSTGGAMGGSGTSPTLTWGDFDAIRNEIGTVRAAAPALRSGAQLVSGELNWSTTVVGSTPEYLEVRNWAMESGSFFTQSDVDTGAKYVVLGQTVVDNLFGPHADPVGQSIRIKNIPFQVVGVLTRKGQSPMGSDYDDTAVIPASTFQAKIQGGLKQLLTGVVYVSATSPATMKQAEGQIADLLRERHRIEPGADDDFTVRNLSEIASAQQQGTKILTALLAAVAAVSLLIGGIGIMNIMLVSVTERTREIGIRMAVGAKPRHILAQFLAEAFVLSMAGGLIGVGLGVLAAQQLAEQFHWPLLIRTDMTLLSLGFSGVVGVLFGLYPALKASRLDPIQALRFE